MNPPSGAHFKTAVSRLSADWARNDPDLDPLRSNPRFLRLLAEAAHDWAGRVQLFVFA